MWAMQSIFIFRSYSRTANSTHNNSIDNRWQLRSKFQRKVLLLIMAVILASGLLVFVVINYTSAAAAPKACRTPACLSAASQISSLMDTSVDPCDNFLKFVCGNFKDHAGREGSATKLANQANRQLLEIMKEPISERDHYLVKSQKELFRACLNETAVGKDTLDIFNQTLEELNGWPVLVGHHWDENKFDWKHMIYKLRQRGYVFSMMLTITPTVDGSNYFITVEGPSMLTHIEDKELYKKYMVDITTTFGAERNRAEEEMGQVWNFLTALQKITYGGSDVKSTVDDFQIDHNQINWLEFINRIIQPSANVSSDDYVIFPSNQYIDDYFGLLARTPKRVQANYIIWKVVESIMAFLPKLEGPQTNYFLATGQPKPSGNRAQFCKNIIEANIYPRPLDIVYARRYLPVEKRNQVDKLFRDVKSEVKTFLRDVIWMDTESKRRNLQTVDEAGAIIGAPGNYFDDAIFNEFGATTVSEDSLRGSNFFNILLNTRKMQTDHLYSLIHKPNNHHIYYDSITEVDALLLPSRNAMWGYLQGTFFNADGPQYLNYAKVGLTIGDFLTTVLYYEDNGWTNETRAAFEEQVQCVVKVTENLESEDARNVSTAVDTELSIASVGGMKMAYNAYKKWARDNFEEMQLPGVAYTPYQLFWISTLSSKCYQLPNDVLKAISEDAAHAFLLAMPFIYNSDFAKDFKCPAGSKMNPLEKCVKF